jgi:hypothetical protein
VPIPVLAMMLEFAPGAMPKKENAYFPLRLAFEYVKFCGEI